MLHDFNILKEKLFEKDIYKMLKITKNQINDKYYFIFFNRISTKINAKSLFKFLILCAYFMLFIIYMYMIRSYMQNITQKWPGNINSFFLVYQSTERRLFFNSMSLNVSIPGLKYLHYVSVCRSHSRCSTRADEAEARTKVQKVR